MDTLCCPNCSFYQMVEDNYCLRCGVNMFLFAADHSVVMMCPECKEIGKGHYCKNCGNKLIGKTIYRRKKILHVVYLIVGVSLVFAGAYWVRSIWTGWKIRSHELTRLEKLIKFSPEPQKKSPRKISPKTVGKLKGLAKEDLAQSRAKEKVSKEITITAARPVISDSATQEKHKKESLVKSFKPIKPTAEVSRVKEADPLEEEDLFRKGMEWFEREIPKLRAQGLVDRVEESDPFVVYVYWAKWRYLSRRRQKDLLNRVKTAREHMDFDEVIEFRDANSRELLASTVSNE